MSSSWTDLKTNLVGEIRRPKPGLNGKICGMADDGSKREGKKTKTYEHRETRST